MARTTAYTASIVAGILADGGIRKKGVIPMESIGKDHDLVKKIIRELGKREVEVKEEKI